MGGQGSQQLHIKRPAELAATGSEGLRCSTSWNWVVAGGGGGGDEGGGPVELAPAEVLESVVYEVRVTWAATHASTSASHASKVCFEQVQNQSLSRQMLCLDSAQDQALSV